MDKGSSPRHDFIDEKFHISVHPQDIGRAYDTIAPILLKHDCPLDYWKVSDVDKAKVEQEKSRLQLRDLEEKRGDYSKLSPEQFEKGRNDLQESVKDSKRLHDECQFTLYLMPEQTGDQFNDLLREIEQALSEAGVRPNELPDSDVPVGKFVSFRTGSVTIPKDHPDYEQLTAKASLIDENGNLKIRINPNAPDYGTHKESFGSNPFYLAQIGLLVDVYRDEVTQQSNRLQAMDGEIGTRDF